MEQGAGRRRRRWRALFLGMAAFLLVFQGAIRWRPPSRLDLKMKIEITKSGVKGKRYAAKLPGKTVNFGARGYEARHKNYLARHGRLRV